MEYQPGKSNPADYLSRHPLSTTDSELDTEEHLNFVLTKAVPKAVKMEAIQRAVDKDETLQSCKRAHMNNSWHKELEKASSNVKHELSQLHKVKDELTVTSSGIILRGNRIVIPKVLRQDILKIAHEGHQGVVKTKQLIPQKVWFPGIDKKARN